MIHKAPLINVRKILVAIGLALATSGAHAASISLDPISGTGPQGSQVTFNLIANFGSTATIGGATDMSWNPSVLTFQSFAFDSGFGTPPRDAGFDVKDLQSAGLYSVGFGNFGGIALATNTTIGHVTFNLVGNPGSSTDIALGDSQKWAGFYDATGAPISVSYTGATAAVSAVPVPAAVWLFGSGLAGLFGVARRSMKRCA